MSNSVYIFCVYIYFCDLYELLLFAGAYYVYDNPAALQDVMLSDLKISTSQFTMFYSLYSWPNVIMCFFGGFLIDRVFGIRWGALIFCAIVTVGHVSDKAVLSLRTHYLIFKHFWHVLTLNNFTVLTPYYGF